MKLVMTRGLPASGKSTWAKAQTGYKRINKDDLRAMLDNGKWSRENEKTILNIRDSLIMKFLEKGLNVIVDDTNLSEKHETRLRELAKSFQADFEIKDFTDVSIQTCIDRDLKRANSVGEKVIRQMYDQFLAPPKKMYVPNPDLPNCIMVDIDGTLALFGDKSPYDRDFSQDTLNEAVAKVVKSMDEGTSIIVLSGRDSKYRQVTNDWLLSKGIVYDKLLMRAEGDIRRDNIVKQELFEKHIQDQFNVLFVLDDRDRVVEMWRSLGLTVFQVAEGNF